MTYVGIDGCSDGWLAAEYSESGYEGIELFRDIEEMWSRHDDAELILVDVPIGLREESGEPRPCDEAARDNLSPSRPTSYEAAKGT